MNWMPKIIKQSTPADHNPFWQGVTDSIPVLVGIAPFGIAYGLMALSVGLTPMETFFMSLIVFAGASQLAAISMIGSGIMEWSTIVLGTFLINLRHLVMGASLAPYMLPLPRAIQLLLSFGIVDETYAITIVRSKTVGYNPVYQLGSNLSAYITWLTSTLAGIILKTYIHDPMSWGLDFAMPATFLALLMPRLIDIRSMLVCAAAALVSVFSALYLSGHWYIIIATLAASLLGGLMEGRNSPCV